MYDFQLLYNWTIDAISQMQSRILLKKYSNCKFSNNSELEYFLILYEIFFTDLGFTSIWFFFFIFLTLSHGWTRSEEYISHVPSSQTLQAKLLPRVIRQYLGEVHYARSRSFSRLRTMSRFLIQFAKLHRWLGGDRLSILFLCVKGRKKWILSSLQRDIE